MADVTTLVVPCYNEERRLDRGTFLAFAESHPSVRFLLVDDGSSDATRQVLHELADAGGASFEVLGFDENRGKAEAVRRGVLHSLGAAPAHVGFWDADLATPLQAIPDFVAVLESRPDVDIVLGSRVRLLGRRIERNPYRHYFGRVAASLVSSMLQLPVYDTQCGAKLFRVTDALPRLWEEPFVTRWVFDVELLARWMLTHEPTERELVHQRIVEQPLEQWTDVAGSKLGRTDFLRAPSDLLRIWRAYGRDLR